MKNLLIITLFLLFLPGCVFMLEGSSNSYCPDRYAKFAGKDMPDSNNKRTELVACAYMQNSMHQKTQN